MLLLHNPNLLLSYPLPASFENSMADYSYLEELYPLTIKEYQRRIKEVVDRLDYPGSMIYDEYPDAISLYRIADEITKEITFQEKIASQIKSELKEDAKESLNADEKTDDIFSSEIMNAVNTEQNGIDTKEKGPCKLIELIQVLLFVEIQKRRVNHQRRYWYSKDFEKDPANQRNPT